MRTQGVKRFELCPLCFEPLDLGGDELDQVFLKRCRSLTRSGYVGGTQSRCG
jgi:hypothetical protein